MGATTSKLHSQFAISAQSKNYWESYRAVEEDTVSWSRGQNIRLQHAIGLLEEKIERRLDIQTILQVKTTE